MPVAEGEERCLACRRHPPDLDAALAAVTYGYPWSNIIRDYKFQNNTGWTRHLALLMRSAPWVELAIDRADWIVPMPLSIARLQERGFNQALLLCRALENSKTHQDVVLRTIHTSAQSSLHRRERLLALQGAFAVAPDKYAQIRGKHILVVDDVMTTGASLFGVARVLRAAGAGRITGLVFARTE